MGRLGRLPVTIPDSVDVKLEKNQVKIKGSKGELSLKVPRFVKITVEDGQLVVGKTGNSKQAREMQGTIRAHIANCVQGVEEGWKKELEINGPGYRAEVKGNDLAVTAGHSQPIVVTAPEGITFKVEKNIISVEGADKQAVGHTASLVRAVRKPNPYTGSGIQYTDEVVRRKAGKQAATKAE